MTKRARPLLKDPKTCLHSATHRVSGTRDLWHCVQCGGLLQDNVTLVEAEEPKLTGIVDFLRGKGTQGAWEGGDG